MHPPKRPPTMPITWHHLFTYQICRAQVFPERVPKKTFLASRFGLAGDHHKQLTFDAPSTKQKARDAWVKLGR